MGRGYSAEDGRGISKELRREDNGRLENWKGVGRQGFAPIRVLTFILTHVKKKLAKTVMPMVNFIERC